MFAANLPFPNIQYLISNFLRVKFPGYLTFVFPKILNQIGNGRENQSSKPRSRIGW